MSTADERLKEKGYRYYCSCETVAEAKRTAKDIKALGMYATTHFGQKNGSFFFSVWIKRNDGSILHLKK